jgi:hypothetical protein
MRIALAIGILAAMCQGAWGQTPHPCYAAGSACDRPPPCGPAQPGVPQPPCAPPQQIIVRVPEQVCAPPAKPPLGAPAPQGMFVAPPQTGTVYGAAESTVLRGAAIHLPSISIRMPSLELPSVQRTRQDARMELDRASAPFMPMSGPMVNQQSAFTTQLTAPQGNYGAQNYGAPGQNLGAPGQNLGAPRQNPTGPGQNLGAPGAPCQPSGAPNQPNLGGPGAPCQPAQTGAPACNPAVPAAAPSGARVPPPPRPTPEETTMRLRQLEELERRIDQKLQHLSAMQQQMGYDPPEAEANRLRAVPAEPRVAPPNASYAPAGDDYPVRQSVHVQTFRPQAVAMPRSAYDDP